MILQFREFVIIVVIRWWGGWKWNNRFVGRVVNNFDLVFIRVGYFRHDRVVRYSRQQRWWGGQTTAAAEEEEEEVMNDKQTLVWLHMTEDCFCCKAYQDELPWVTWIKAIFRWHAIRCSAAHCRTLCCIAYYLHISGKYQQADSRPHVIGWALWSLRKNRICFCSLAEHDWSP